MKNIWKDLKKPFFVLAPMEDVTDTVFRQVIASCGAPDLFFTEFTSVEGMGSVGREKVIKRLKYSDIEKPLIAQIWGKTPEKYYEGAKQISKMGFDGIDINMGCPVKKIVKQGACSALIKNQPLAKEIIDAVKEGAVDMPISVKTRIGFDSVDTENWIGFLLEQDLSALTVHGRLASEMSKKENDWNEIGKAVKLKEEMGKDTVMIGNGDVLSIEQGEKLSKEYGLDGIMIGRGIFQNPWVFNRKIKKEDITKEMRLEKLVEHVKLFEEVWRDTKNFEILKKFFKIYVSGYDGASKFRNDLMNMKEYNEVYEITTLVQR